MDAPDAAELEVVAAQLGRAPTGVVRIAARCPAGHPSVVTNYPLQEKRGRPVPFPTLHWLTCPELVRAVSRLEMVGLIDEFDTRLENDDEFAAAVATDHASYVEERWNLLDAAARTSAETAGLLPVLRERGIGGIANRRSVKCLHLHLAHHLAAHNTIGALLVAEHGIAPCV